MDMHKTNQQLHLPYIYGSTQQHTLRAISHPTTEIWTSHIGRAMITSLLRQATTFMKNAIETDGSNLKTVVDKQFTHVSTVIRRSDIDTEDANTALAFLRQSSHFGVEQRKALRTMVVDCTSAGGEAVIRTDSPHKSQKKKNVHMYN